MTSAYVSGCLLGFEIGDAGFDLLKSIEDTRIFWSGRGRGRGCGCFCFDLLIRLLKCCGDFFECGSFNRDFVGFCFA